MYVAVKQQAESALQQGTNEPAINPISPPDFAICIAQIHQQIPTLAKTPVKTLRSECLSAFNSSKSEVMDYLIESYWYQAYANKLGITVSQSTLNTALAAAKKQLGGQTGFETYLKEGGQTAEDVNFQLRVSQLYSKLIKRFEKPVNAAAIAAYYAAHKSSFGKAAYADLHLVRTASRAKAQAAYHALKSGQSWTTVAKTYSASAAGKANGGLLTNVTQGEEEAAVNTAILLE